jgi:imidazolonepropionase
MRTLWRKARIATCDGEDRQFERGAILTRDEKIEWVGSEEDIPAGARPDRVVELADRWLLPGLIDCHTHLVFAGQRAGEFARRTAGESYADIARAGGGIRSTMQATRAASEEDLLEASGNRLQALLDEGVTTVEIKSGYGLTLASEVRMLRVARRLAREHSVDVSTSFLGAHALPPEYAGRADEYVDTICREWLPALVSEGLVDAVDAYIEPIAFSLAQCERLFAAADALGCRVRLHAEQFSNQGGSLLAARYRALSCDHLEYAGDEEAAALARSGSVAVLLPIAFYVLAETRLPPIESLRKRGVPLAVATDCNPGSAPCASLLLALNMARRLFGLDSREVLHGATRHAARALGLADRGAIAPGLAADFSIWSVDTLDELGYWTGFNPCSMVVKRGAILRERAI